MLGRPSTENNKNPGHAARGYPRRPIRPMDSKKSDPFLEYRLRVVLIGLVASVVGLVGIGIWMLGRPNDGDPTNQWVLLLCLGAVVLLAITPWRYVLGTASGNVLIVLWSAVVVVALTQLENARGGLPSAVGFLMVVIFAGATVIPAQHLIVVAMYTITGYAFALFDYDGAVTGSTAVLFTAFLAAVVTVVLLIEGIRAQLHLNRAELDKLAVQERLLQGKERELASLYEVSATIGAGSNLAEVLPELVGRVVLALDARTGLVLLYRPRDEALEVMSPIWVSGHTVEAEGYSLALNHAGLAQRVFISGEAALDNGVVTGRSDQLLLDLDARRIAAVPLRVEQRRIGVLLVADKADGDFRREDLVTLESLASPAALVLNQMARYEEARATGAKMAELARLKTDFVSVVSHELRTPLTSIIGSLRTLQRPELAPQNPDAVELISTATKQANRLRRLIEDLLVVSRLDAAALPVNPESLAPNAFLADVIRAIPLGPQRVRATIDDDVTRIDGDPDHLARVLTNLIENSLKHSGEGNVTVHASTVGNEVRIAVVDHGTGIPYDRRDHVFDRFTQLQPHETRSRGGTGLGLFIVRGLAEAMGGRVWYEPTVGGGSTFIVALPVTASVAVG